MNAKRARERGQALILVVFAIVGLSGLTGLAIDGGGAYSDRRHAQNAADTAVMAAALTRVRHASDADQVAAGNTAQPAALDIAGTNNYSQVTIRSTIRTYLAPVVGIRQLTHFVQAVAKAVPPVALTWYNGSALV